MIVVRADGKIGTEVPPQRQNDGATAVAAWPTVLKHLCGIFKGASAQIVAHYYASGQGRLIHAIGIDADGFRHYEQRFGGTNIWFRQERHFVTPGTVTAGQTIVDDAVVEGTEFYRDWLQPQGLFHHMFGVLDRHDRTSVVIVVARSHGMPAFTQDDAALLGAVLPVLTAAWQMERLARRRLSQASAAWTVLDRLSVGILLVDERYRAVGRNQRAALIAQSKAGLLVCNGVVACESARENAQFRRVVDALLTSPPTPGPAQMHALRVSRPNGGAPLQLILTRVAAVDRGTRTSKPLVAIFLSDPEQFGLPRQEWLRELYGLTRVEAEVSVLMCRGLTPEEISTTLRISVHTVRGYLKDIYQKLGVQRQSGVVRQLLGGPAQVCAGGEEAYLQ